jgi:predicted 3-demethylubiquinone-9 3-methyltransferase (glyoxalase superfamily)
VRLHHTIIDQPDKELNPMPATQKLTTFLWFNDNAEDAIHFYTGIFANSKVLGVTRRGEALIHATFQLHGQQFMALNGGPAYHFTEAVSLHVNRESQEEVDDLWDKLSAGGSKGRCGWLKDKFGLSWQIIPSALGQLLADKDPQKAGRAMQAMLQMDKIDIQKLREAAGPR